MKTKDGVECKPGKYYYLENGQQVILQSCATTHDGFDAFMVVPFYEGEAMEMTCTGGSPYEVTTPYEHEGEPILVLAIFDKAPTDKLDARYQARMVEIEKLSLAIGELQRFINEETHKKQRLISETKELFDKNSDIESQTYQAKQEIESLNEVLSQKRQTLSEFEDSISKFSTGCINVVISQKELQRLNKRDFELQCLESGGVDNWEWYSESLKDYLERYPE